MGRYNGYRQKKLKEYRLAKVIEQCNKCFWCHTPFTVSNPATVDHIIPHHKGGKLQLDNIVAACFTCNNERGELSFEEYLLKKEKEQNVE